MAIRNRKLRKPATLQSAEVSHPEEMALVELIERDRQRIGRALHDSACQSLSGLQLLAGVLLHRASPRAKEADGGIGEFGELLRRTSRELSRIVHWLCTPAMVDKSLVFSLRELARETSATVPCFFKCGERQMKIAPRIARQLYQIAHAVTLSAAEGGKASQIEIELSSKMHRAPEISLSIWDDGPPLSGPGAEARLCNWEFLELRARAAGGKLSIRDAKSGGVRVTCRVPAGH